MDTPAGDRIQTGSTYSRLAYVGLLASPLVILPLAGTRALRIPGVHEIVGLAVFSALAACAWILAARKPVVDAKARLAGLMFLLPFALVALLWIGIGTPWDATAEENRMRYGVLLAATVAATTGFAALKRVLEDDGEHVLATLCGTTALLSGAAYLVWNAFHLGFWSLRAARGEAPAAVVDVENILDALLFAAGALAYLATATASVALGRSGRLAPTAARLSALVNLLALALLLARGVRFPMPDEGPLPWYANVGFVVGVPATPWIVPYLLGAVLLRRAGRAP